MSPKILQAFELMYSLEPKKYRKFSPLPQGFELYWTHLYSVYKTCIYWGYNSEELLLAAILHDAIEDTPYTYEEIVSNFGETVAIIVDLCTKKEHYQDFVTESQQEYFGRITSHSNQTIRQAAMVIKLADRLDNLSGMSFITDEKIKDNYVQETLDFYLPMAKILGKEEQLNNLLNYLNKYEN